MEYASGVWDGTYENDLTKLEKNHVDGMQLVTGSTAHSIIANLYSEICWQSINNRYKNWP